MSLLEIDQVTKIYNPGQTNSVLAVDDISVDISEEEFFSIIGPTGCGKSTLMSMIAGLVEPTEGEIRINSEPISGPHPDVGVVFQDESTFPWRTTRENVEFGLEMHGTPKSERRDTAREVIDLVGLSGFEEHYPNQLSGGMRQRVAIARTLAMGPDIMLMDEPFGALDEQTRMIIGNELLRIWEETNQTTMFITHSISEAVFLSDKVLVMTARPGRVKAVVEVDIDRPRNEDIVTDTRFNELTDRLWELLRPEAHEGFEQSKHAGEAT